MNSQTRPAGAASSSATPSTRTSIDAATTVLRAAGDDEGMTLRIDIGGLPSGRLRFAASPLAEQIYVLTSTENFEKPTEVCE
ncbi:hypothetical protein GCM10018953_59780 [Streptosporangium nondiastaticum]